MELEARINAGDLELPGVRRLVMIQCVGSREPEHPYCSRLCCLEALKNALLLKERYPALEIIVLYRDVRAYGFNEGYYQQAKAKGVVFIPFDGARPPRVAAPPRRPLTVWVRDELLGQEVGLAADRVVLSAGIEPAADCVPFTRRLKISQTLEGFLQEAHQKLRPVDAAAEGVFLCGLAHSPRTLGETVAQARAAAGRAAGVLFQTELRSGEITAAIAHREMPALPGLSGGVSLRRGAGGRLAAGGQPRVVPGLRGLRRGMPPAAIHLSRGTEAELMAQIREALAS